MRFVALVSAVAAVSVAGLARAEDGTSTAELRQQIESLQKKVDQIEARQAAKPEVNATTAAVQADALQRSQLLQTQPFLGGYDKGFKISSADGRFVLQPGVQFQFRNITNFNTTGDDETVNGFEVRRLRIRLDGTAFSKDLRYSFVLDNNRNGGTTTLLDAWAQYNFTEKWGVKLGQFRNSWAHEGDISDTKQLAVERSLVDAVLGGSQVDRVQAVALTYGSTGDNADPLQGEVAFTDGDNSRNTDFRDSDGPDPTSRADGNFGASGRIAYKFFGNWADYSDFTAKGDKLDLLVAGAGVDFSENGDTNITRLNADAQYENTAGLSAYAVLHYNIVDSDTTSADDFGGAGQVGYLINPAVEVFGRYSYVNLDNGFLGEESFHEITGGVNYFFGPDGAWGHAVKVTVDLNYLPNGSPGSFTGLGYTAGTEDEFVLRAQFQLAL